MSQTLTALSGLSSVQGKAAVPLVGVSARVEIRDYGCRVVLSQRYRNDEAQPIEVVYKFPLDEGAAVCGFEAEIDGRIVKGRVEEREKAFDVYDDALRAGHGAYLLDEERADVFTASVGNLLPGKEAVLRLTTVCELPLEGDAIRFTLPTAVAPRYAPASDRKGVGESEAERLSPPFALEVPYGLELELEIATSAPVRSVESPSHPVQVTLADGRATVHLAQREAALDRDVVIKIALAETHEPRALVERAPDGQAYALVSFRPKLEARMAPAEVVFLVDRSGSMQGASIAEAKNALELALRSLRPGCLFNIIGFGSRFESLFPKSRAYDEDSLAEATKHVKSLDADLGGTEIRAPLEQALGAPTTEGLPRQVFVLTDGQVTNTDEVIAVVRRHAHHARLFTFGIGAGASHHLVKGLARAGEGEAEFIAPGERIEAKVLRQLSRALTPALVDVTLDWGPLAATQAPHDVPPVFADGRVLVLARLGTHSSGSVTLRARTLEGLVVFPAVVDPLGAPEGTLVGTLWARRMIRDLEEGSSALHPRRGSQQARATGLQDEKVKAEIVGLGTTWSLASRHTSFVAVEERAHPTEAEAELRKVPVAITRGWHGVPHLVMGSPARSGDTGALFAVAAPAAMLGDARFGAAPRASRSPGLLGRAITSLRGGSRPASPAATPHQRPLDHLVALQRADGSWALDDGLATLMGWKDVKALRKALPRTLADDASARAAATALALDWLETCCADARDEWRLLADKAREWLARTPEGLDTWLGLARGVREAKLRP